MPKLSRSIIFVVLLLMICTHLVVFIYYAEHNKRAEALVNRDLIIQQVINIIERVNYTMPMHQERIVSAIDIPNVSASINNQAKYALHFTQASSLWDISRKIHFQPRTIQLSLKLLTGKWLNVSANIMPRSLWLQMFLLILEIITVSAVIFSIWSINRFAKPLKNFTKAAKRLGVDLHAQPLAEYGPAIVRETAHAMNQMQVRIRDLLNERTKMLAALSHDLRTPITRMKLRSQFINDEEVYHKNTADLNEMEAMIADTLAFAKNDVLVNKKVKLDLDSLLASICDDYTDMGKNIVYHSPGRRFAILGRRLALKRALTNLIENALKYAGSAQISLFEQANNIHITIDDDGPGILEAQLQTIFQPFVRGENSRSRDTGGTGLGLSVARDIILAHDGTINLSNRVNGGLRARITFDQRG